MLRSMPHETDYTFRLFEQRVDVFPIRGVAAILQGEVELRSNDTIISGIRQLLSPPYPTMLRPGGGIQSGAAQNQT